MSFGLHPPQPVPAPLDRRIGAYLINTAIGVVAVLVVFFLGLLVIALGEQAGAGAVSGAGSVIVIFVYLFGGLAWSVALAVMESRSASPGKRLLGLRVARVSSGENLTTGQAFGRVFVLGLIGGLTFGIATIIMIVLVARDPSRGGRMWHDQAFDSIVVDERAVSGPPDPSDAAPDQARPFGQPLDRPVPVSAPGPAAPVAPAPRASSESSSAPRLAPPPPHRAPAPAPAPPPPTTGLITGVPGSSAPPVPPAPPGPSSPPSPSAPAAGGAAAAASTSTAPEAEDDDEDVTRYVRRPSTPPSVGGWRVVLADGTAVVVDKATLLGRDPAPRGGEDAAALVPVRDGDRLVSKTHLLLRPEGGALWAVDRGSTNGTQLVRAGEPPRRLVPEDRTELRTGDQLSLGGVVITVQRT
ncbi:RDD family protein [Quadrisphaera oryzae]|uniref:RDD family protein n=1 Tax=Quadrisphaera TaxID=317661 RepID=UPI0016491D3A|nr:RDD family protein [Quadrisphaera sp. RL12-1S]MBC3764160.1 RDD family protein [Quadrisphaera sp. RL12-1S]